MNFSSVSGKNWLFKKFNSSDVIKFSENFSSETLVFHNSSKTNKIIKNQTKK